MRFKRALRPLHAKSHIAVKNQKTIKIKRGGILLPASLFIISNCGTVHVQTLRRHKAPRWYKELDGIMRRDGIRSSTALGAAPEYSSRALGRAIERLSSSVYT